MSTSSSDDPDDKTVPVLADSSATDETDAPAGESDAPPSDDLSDIDEDVQPGTSPVIRFQKANNRLRRWVVGGLGFLLFWVLTLGPMLVIFRPELTNFATAYIQVAVGGFLGIAGSVVGFLFAREQDRD